MYWNAFATVMNYADNIFMGWRMSALLVVLVEVEEEGWKRRSWKRGDGDGNEGKQSRNDTRKEELWNEEDGKEVKEGKKGEKRKLM